MSARGASALDSARRLRVQAPVFAALGDQTRLSLLVKLCDGAPRSIAQLSAGTEITRQAITKHLRVLEGAGVVRSRKEGRESQFTLQPAPLQEARDYLDRVSAQWDQALARLKAFVEHHPTQPTQKEKP